MTTECNATSPFRLVLEVPLPCGCACILCAATDMPTFQALGMTVVNPDVLYDLADDGLSKLISSFGMFLTGGLPMPSCPNGSAEHDAINAKAVAMANSPDEEEAPQPETTPTTRH